MYRLFSTIATLCLLLVLGGAGHPQRVIEYDLERGLRYDFEQSTTTNLNLTIELSGQQVNATESSRQVTSGSVEVIEVEEGRTRVARVQFSDAGFIESTSSVVPQPQRVPFALAGRAVEVTADSDGSITIAAAASDQRPLPPLTTDTEEMVRSLAIPDPNFPPKHPVGVDDSWTANLGHRDDAIHPSYTFKVVALRTEEKPQSAQLEARTSFETTQEGLTFRVDLTGHVKVDLSTGLPIESTMSGPVNVQGTSDMGGGNMATITGTGSIEQVMRIQFRDDASPRHAQLKPAANPVADEAHPNWKVYSSALSSLTFKYPPDWRVEMSPDGLLMVPGDHDPLREMLFGIGAPAAGATDAASAQAQQRMDLLVQSQAPMLRRSGAPTPIKTETGSGASYKYVGQLPDGRQAVCLMLVRILDDESAVLGIIADEARTNQRSAILHDMFGTIAVRDAAEQAGGVVGDRKLIGMFQGEVLNSNTEGIYMNTQLVYAFGADGRVYYGGQSMFSASKRDHNDDLIWTASGGTDGSARGGNWTTANGLLTIRWDDGEQSVFAYGFEPDQSLVLRNPYTKELINFFPRVR